MVYLRLPTDMNILPTITHTQADLSYNHPFWPNSYPQFVHNSKKTQHVVSRRDYWALVVVYYLADAGSGQHGGGVTAIVKISTVSKLAHSQFG